MWYLYHRLGIQSNVVVAAQYASVDTSRRLSKPVVLNALRAVVEAQPQLRIVGVPTPAVKKGNLNLSIAMLQSIDLESCVEFVDDATHSGITAEILERAHNEWEFLNPDRPWFKLVVVGQDTVVFIYHHLVADGTSGSIFHREFLAALNSMASSAGPDTPGSSGGSSPWVVHADPSTSKIAPSIYDIGAKARELGKPWNPSMLLALWPVFVFWVIQLFFSSHFVFSDLPDAKPHLASVTGVADESQRIVSKTILGRIPATKMKKVLAACRANGTTFTPLLNVMIMLTLVNDYYPQATYGASRISTDIRRRLPPSLVERELDTIGNRAGGMGHIEWVQKYRRLVKKGSDLDKLGDKTEGTSLDAPGIWELARSNKKWIEDTMESSCRGLQTHQASGPDLDYFVTNVLPMVGLVSRATFLVSNTGSFLPRQGEIEGHESGCWRVVDLVFSAAPTNGHLGSRGPVFNVAGVKGGDTTVAAGWEEGVASRELVQGVLDATLARIDALVA